MVNFSVVIPVYNESENIKKLIEEINDSLISYDQYEIIIVNDGSNDNTLKVIDEIKKNYALKLINNSNNLGQSRSIYNGIINSEYKTIVTIDGDGQNDPKDIPSLLKLYFSSQSTFLVGGIRKERKDNFIKILSSRIANSIRSFILKDNCSDTGCSLKVFDKDIFLSFPFFDSIHRFLPALFNGYGYNTNFKNVSHRPRLSGKSKYGTIYRLVLGIIDLFRVMIIIKKHNKKND